MAQHDVVVVGAGPAGLSAAAELSRGGDCLLLEQGRGQQQRDRDDALDILAGIGGAGLFSDGKHSFYPSASALWTLSDRAALAGAFDRTAALLERHGLQAAPWQEATAAEPGAGAWHLKHYPAIYMALPQRMAVIAELAQACARRWTGARLIAADRDGAHIRLTVLRDGETTEVHTRAVVIATGRLSPRWLAPLLRPLGVRFVFRRLEFGLRIESRADAALFRRLVGTDPKLRFREPDGATEIRTFCVCRDGEVVHGAAVDANTHTTIVACSGRADGPATGRSNVGLLVRTSDEPLARAIAPTLFAATPCSLPLAGADAAALRPLFAEPGAALVRGALDRLCAWCPALADDDHARVHGPCIEGVGDYPDDDGALQLAPGVWVAGDACGRFRGIVACMVSGRYVAARITGAGRR